MDRVNKNSRLKDIRRKPTMWVQHTYVGDGTDKTICLPDGIKCISNNTEYMSSPGYDYFGSTISTLDINIYVRDISFQDDSQNNQTILQFGINGTPNQYYMGLWFQRIQQTLGFTIFFYDQVSFNFSWVYGETIPTGRLQIVYEVDKLVMKHNGVIVAESVLVDELIDMTLLANSPLFFANGPLFSGGDRTMNVTIEKVQLGINEWNFTEGTGNTTINNQGIVTTLHSDLQGDVEAVKCIDANDEYMSSPSGNYLGNTISGVDVEADYSELDLSQLLIGIIHVGEPPDLNTFQVQIRPSLNDIRVAFSVNEGSELQNFIYVFPSTIPLSGNIKVKGNGLNLEVYFDDVLVINDIVTIQQDISVLQTKPLRFGAIFNTSSVSGITYNYIKIGIHEWTFTEGSGSTTTNSQGVVTTLHSSKLGGIKFQVNNNEYLTNPIDNYFGSDINDLDLEFIIIDRDKEGNLLSQGSWDNDEFFMIYLSHGSIVIYIGDLNFDLQDFSYAGILPSSFNLKIRANGGNLEILIDDTIVFSESIFINFDLSSIAIHPLYFNGVDDGFGISEHQDITLNYIKLNNDIWTFPEGSGSTTTNNNGIISTLQSDIDVEAMWQLTGSTQSMWQFLNDVEAMWLEICS